MNKNEVKDTIQFCIEDLQGCKATELIIKLADYNIPFEFIKTMTEVCTELVNEKRIMEIEYIIPAMPYRTKTFYLPKNSQVRFEQE